MHRTFTTRITHGLVAAALTLLGATTACRPRPGVTLPTRVASDDSVQVGYGAQARTNVATSVTTATEKQLRRHQTTSVGDMLERLPGVRVTRSGASFSVRIRAASGEPLYVVDGVPRQSFGPTLATLHPSDIRRIDVLKDAGAAAAYGMRGANGVIIIHTKGTN